MCGRFTELTWDEVAQVAHAIEFGLPMVGGHEWPARGEARPQPPGILRPGAADPSGPGAPAGGPAANPRPDVFPNQHAPIILAGAAGKLEVTSMIWGFRKPKRPDGTSEPGTVFNTRLETAAQSAFWAESFHSRRCIIPTAAFYEPHRDEVAPNPVTGRDAKRLYRFHDHDTRVLLMAGIWQAERFSVMTTKPDHVVGAVHDRMPLVLSATNALHWLRMEPAVPQRIRLVSRADWGSTAKRC